MLGGRAERRVGITSMVRQALNLGSGDLRWSFISGVFCQMLLSYVISDA